MKKIKVNPKVFYFATIIIFIALIMFFTAIYPETYDEFRLAHSTWAKTFAQIKTTFTTDAPRFLMIFNILFLHFAEMWKVVFSILNPFVQLFIVFGLFFVATGRKVNFKTTQDFCPFLLLCLIYLFLSPKPSNTLLWISGAICYSWAFVPSLILLCLFRKTIDGKTFKNSVLSNFLMCFCGFAAGMSNENTGPMIFCITVLFLIYCKYKKVKMPKFYYFALAGIILGIATMFGSGASAYRASNDFIFAAWRDFTFAQKFNVFTIKINNFLNALFWLPVINLMGLFLILYDKKKQIIKNKDFILSCLFLILAVVLFTVLFFAPTASLRAYYSSAMFFFISFIILILMARKIYSFNFAKYLSLILLIIITVEAPLIAIPHLRAYKEHKQRIAFALQQKKANSPYVFLTRLTILKGPTKNWTLEYCDFVVLSEREKLIEKFGENIHFEAIPEELIFANQAI